MTIATGEQILAAEVNAEFRQFVELVGNEHQPGGAGDGWNDWDISAIIPAGSHYALIECLATGDVNMNSGARKNGSALARIQTHPVAETFRVVLTECDANRVIEIYTHAGTGGARNNYSVLGYWQEL